ncbi:1-phosphofructokinase family hexose kinase [Mycoplasma sp. E35C]|uniref:1-phosphofructokinase n=1 Tax=Mycoplasma sp. E35C TaxID=2801918 RepID=UPI001CA3D297|nr:1-phosphofructokinase family hexose kinase [Mycoplasma sp. E35C]QZX49376.1 1-phosphofructokinase family hexose kinase [Mycoplasma sp. E35C]
MIYTITFSPSIDYVIKDNQQFKPDGLNRINDYDFYCGGKGINASVVLKRIGFDNKAISFVGGKTKQFFIDLLNNETIELINFEVKDNTRINVKYFNDETSFEINGPRTKIDQATFNQFLELIKSFKSDDLVFVMGTCELDQLDSLLKVLVTNNIEFVLDVDLNKNLELLKYHPYLIKPNRDELSRMVDCSINNQDDILNAADQLIKLGAKNVMVSDGKNGSYLVLNNHDTYQITIDPIKDIKSTVGAGDSLISSFVCLYKQTKDINDALIKATSISIGTASSMWLANKSDLTKYQDKIHIKKIR